MDNSWRWYFLLISIYIFINLLFLTNSPPIWPDESIMAEYASNLNNQQKLISFLHGSMYHADKGLFFYPPLLPIIFALGFKITGISVVTQRLIALLFGLFLLLFFLKERKHHSIFWLGILWLSDFTLMRASRFSRPEIFILSLTFFNLWLLFSQMRFRYYLSSIVSVLSFLIHPLGVITILLNSLFLVYKRFYKYLLFFSVILAAGLLFWFYTINFQLNFLLQILKLQATRRIAEPDFFTYLKQSKLINLIFVNYLYLGLSIFLIIYFWFEGKKDLLVKLITAGLIIGWFFVFYGKEPWYYVYPLPFVYFLWLKFGEIMRTSYKNVFFVIISLLIVFFNLNLVRLDWQNNQASYYKFINTLAARLPEKSTVFLSSIPDAYFGLKTSSKKIKLYQFAPLPEKKQQYLNILNGSDYVLYTSSLDYGFTSLLKNYLEKNTQKIILINNGQTEYQARLIKLVPINKRRY